MKQHFSQRIELDRAALDHNLGEFRELIGSDRILLAMVKANAYGHGMLEVAQMALASDADWLGVHALEEGMALRSQGITDPILVVGPIPVSGLKEAVSQDLRMTVYNADTLRHLQDVCRSSGKQARIHIKIETGTYRQGMRPEELKPFMDAITNSPDLILEGISSHFANIEDTTNHAYAKQQLKKFKAVLNEVETLGIQIPMRHFSCSAATILFPETYFDMVRVGIGMYGLWPSKETYLSCIEQNRKPLTLQPVLSWKACISQIKAVPKGAMVGYGCTYKTTREALLAVIPVGYSDGYPRDLSNIAHVLIKGQRAPLRGRVAMNFITVDVTDIPDVSLEDEVVLIGSQGEDAISADTLAAWVGSINYEIVARLNPLIPRIEI